MNPIRLALAALLLCTSLIADPAIAASYSTDQSDLWWADPPGSENGWGIELVQRKDTIFATMFVYGDTGAPTWYVATMGPLVVVGALAWSGDLYTTSGPWFGAVPYNPALFTFRKVGTMAWKVPSFPSATSVIRGTLTYDVDGVPVTKSLIRETLVNEDYEGHFGGVIHEDVGACLNPANNGTTETVGQLGIKMLSQVLIGIGSKPNTPEACEYDGVLQQFGQMGDVVGSYSCVDGRAGSFHIFEFQVNELGVTGRLTKSATIPAGCLAEGWFGGVTVTTF